MTDLSPVEGGVAAVLMAAADLLDKPGAWQQGGYASNAAGDPVFYEDDDAVCFCIRGAVRRVMHKSGADFPLSHALIPGPRWNDAPERTQAEVVQALRTAAQASATSPSGGGE